MTKQEERIEKGNWREKDSGENRSEKRHINESQIHISNFNII